MQTFVKFYNAQIFFLAICWHLRRPTKAVFFFAISLPACAALHYIHNLNLRDGDLFLNG